MTTVLAVVVAGQVAERPQGGDNAQSNGGTERGDGSASVPPDGRGTPRRRAARSPPLTPS